MLVDMHLDQTALAQKCSLSIIRQSAGWSSKDATRVFLIVQCVMGLWSGSAFLSEGLCCAWARFTRNPLKHTSICYVQSETATAVFDLLRSICIEATGATSQLASEVGAECRSQPQPSTVTAHGRGNGSHHEPCDAWSHWFQCSIAAVIIEKGGEGYHVQA